MSNGRKTSALFYVFCFLFVWGVLPACNKKTAEPQTTVVGQTLHTCPMQPQLVPDKPGDCPICNMKLVLRERAAASTAPAANGVPGQAAVQIEPAQAQRIGVKVAPVEVREIQT